MSEKISLSIIFVTIAALLGLACIVEHSALPLLVAAVLWFFLQ
jgi:hypothetical protein